MDRLTRKLYPNLVASRNSREDRGRQIPEGGRGNMEAILFANFRRCEESLRCLEEYGKLFGPQGSQFKEIRYRIYDLEQRVCQKILK
ncbi:MAG: hypothetical protein HYY63_01350 [Elusimicrobia bacterium]|nr:hypothetical protein [Elusimicrobiota bacterium]